MLKLYYYVNLFPGGGASIHSCCAELEEASSVKLTSEINGLYTLDFDYPYSSDKAKLIKENYEIEPPVGLGQLQWKEFIAMLYNVDYEGFLVIEPHGPKWGNEEKMGDYIKLSKRHLEQYIL